LPFLSHNFTISVTFAGEKAWYNVMRLLGGYDTSDTELLVYACTLMNKTLNGLSDLDTYYDQVDAIEEQGMKDIVQQCVQQFPSTSTLD
jgi:hypothetical protein